MARSKVALATNALALEDRSLSEVQGFYRETGYRETAMAILSTR